MCQSQRLAEDAGIAYRNTGGWEGEGDVAPSCPASVFEGYQDADKICAYELDRERLEAAVELLPRGVGMRAHPAGAGYVR